jgi:hypothetical protein
MRHFLLLEALALAVLLLPDGVGDPPVEGALVLAPVTTLFPSPLRSRALPTAVFLSPVAGATQGENSMTSLADPNP